MLGVSTQILLDNGIVVFFNLLNILILIKVFASWLPINQKGGLMGVVSMLTDPILLPVKALIDKSPLGGRGMMLDFSPIIAIFLLQVIERLLISLVHM